MKLLLLGSTGSIGTSTLQCVRRFKEMFTLTGLACCTSGQQIVKQALEFNVPAVSITDPVAAEYARKHLPESVRIYQGRQGLIDMVAECEYDVVLNALVGAAGFVPTVTALQRNKKIALANKESLVIGGDLIGSLLDKGKGSLVPVDSEHSAILQCLNGEDTATIETLTITASGGPFREKNLEEFKNITPQEALKHPTWAMGNKITIDSSTLINKGFEIIEAHHLFRLPYDKLTVLIHPQSIIHSMVTFHDGAIMAQCGVPDMELPIQYALSYPKRLPISSTRLKLHEIGSLTFEEPDYGRFPCLSYCIEAGKQGGTITTVLNAANEIAVKMFLDGTIGYHHIPKLIDQALLDHNNQKANSVEIIEEIDKLTRNNIIKYIHNT